MPEKSIFQIKVENFAQCAYMHYLQGNMSAEEAINTARKIAADTCSSYQMEQGEKMFRRWINK